MKLEQMLIQHAESQTRKRGRLEDEYEIYVSCSDDGTGHCDITGEPLKTFDEWLNS